VPKKEITDVQPDWENPLKYLHPAIDFKDGVQFLGVYLPATVTESDGEVESTKTMKMPFIITSDKECEAIDPTEKTALGYSFAHLPMEIDRWGLEDIKKYIDDKAEDVEFAQVFEMVKSKLKQYWDAQEEAEYDLVVAWIMSTYFAHIFSSFPILFLNAVKQAGKTKLLTFINCLGFNFFVNVDMKGANIYRLRQETRGGLGIDEIENISSKEESTVRTLIISAYKKGIPVIRQEKVSDAGGERYRSVIYELYGPVALANIKGIDDVLENRAITLTLRRTINRTIANMKIDIVHPAWEKRRNLLYLTLMKYAKHVKLLDEYMSHINFSDLENVKGAESGKGDRLEQSLPSEVAQPIEKHQGSGVKNDAEVAGVNNNRRGVDVGRVGRDKERERELFSGTLNNTHTVFSGLPSLPISTWLDEFNAIVEKKDVFGRDYELWQPIFIMGAFAGKDVFYRLYELSKNHTYNQADQQLLSTSQDQDKQL